MAIVEKAAKKLVKDISTDKFGKIIEKLSRKTISRVFVILAFAIAIAAIIIAVGMASGNIDFTSADMKALVNTINQDRKEQHELNKQLSNYISELQKITLTNSIKINQIEQDIKEIKSDIKHIKEHNDKRD